MVVWMLLGLVVTNVIALDLKMLEKIFFAPAKDLIF